MTDYKRLQYNLEILERHNEIHTPIFHLTDGKTHEQDLIRELITDCRELLSKIEKGTLVDCIWFISWLNETVCCGQVIGYEEDSGFVILTNGSMISADKIWTNCEDAEKELLKRKIKELDEEEYQEFKQQVKENLKELEQSNGNTNL